jgi:hypothetical protein
MLLGLAVFRPPIEGYVASAIIEYGGPAAKEALAVELRQYGATRIKVRQMDGAPEQFAISLVGRDRNESLAALEERISHFVAGASAVRMVEDRVAIARAAEQLAESEQSEQDARSAYESWRQDRREAEKTAEARARSAKAGSASPKPTQTGSAESRLAPNLNPEWVELMRQLERLRGEREQLLVTHTPAHPRVIETEFRIGEVEQQLVTTQQHLPGSDVPGPSGIDSEEPSAEPAVELGAESLPDPAEGEGLKAAWDDAIRRLDAAREDYLRAQKKRVPAPRVDVHAVAAPEIVGIDGGDLRTGWVVALALASLALGLTLARASSLSSHAALFATVDEITQTLKIPVIAALATADGPVIPQRKFHRVKAAKLAARALAATAILLVTALLYAAAVDPLVLHIASSDPVQAYALAIELVWPL